MTFINYDYEHRNAFIMVDNFDNLDNLYDYLFVDDGYFL